MILRLNSFCQTEGIELIPVIGLDVSFYMFCSVFAFGIRIINIEEELRAICDGGELRHSTLIAPPITITPEFGENWGTEVS